MIASSSMKGELVGEWKSGPQSISLYHSNNHFLARIQDQTDTQTEIDSAHIKCGILGKTPHDLLIQKIVQLAREKIKDHIAVCCYPSQGPPTEVWVFEAIHGAALWIKKAKENLKQVDSEKEEKAIDCLQEALQNFKTALNIQKNQEGNIAELDSVILHFKKELLLQQIKRDLPLYLSSEQEKEAFNKVIDLYKEEDLFSGLSEYLKAFDESTFSPCQLFLSALMDEHFDRPLSAIQNYLHLAEHHPDPRPCFKKAEELVKQSIKSDPFALPQFLEKLARNKLIELRQTPYPENLERLLLQKDAVRMTFEKCLTTLNQHSPQKKAPTCFICFNDEEADVGRWLERVLVPDLDRMGIQPLFCFRDLNPGKGDLNNFQSLIRGADQVMIVCTPDLKRKCEEGRKAPMGVAQEIRLARQRYNDSDKYETNFLLYLKGNKKTSCPDVFFEPIQGTTLTLLKKSKKLSVLSYYENAFEFFGGMRNIPRIISREIRDDFLLKANKIFAGEIDQKELEKWRQEKQSQTERVLKAVQEQVTKMTQMVDLPLPPKDFTGRKQELQDLHTACQHQSRVAITGLGGIGKTALALKYANDHQTDYQFIYLIRAETSQSIRDWLLKLADELYIPRVERIEERLELLKRRLDRFEQKYLLIFDGIDQIEAFDEFTKYLPDRGNCLLLTSRMPGQSTTRNFELIELKPFSLEDAVDYLLQATGSKEEDKASELAERLGRLPLALKHAAGYIRSSGISIHKYIQVFDQFQLKLFEDERLSLLTKEKKTILTTWNISLNAIETVHKCPLAKEVIAFFAFLGQAPIPLDLISDWFKMTYPPSKELDLLDALRYLCGYSMIDGSSDFYQIHPLVQQVTHHQMANPQQVFEQVIMTLTLKFKQFQRDDANTWNPTRPTIPHALSLFKLKDLMASITLKKQFAFMTQLGNICLTYGDFYQALEVKQGSLEIAKRWNDLNPQFHIPRIALANNYNDIGGILDSLGKFAEALEYYQKASEVWLDLYGEVDSNLARTYNNIVVCLDSLERYDEAEEYLKKALNIFLNLHGEEHPDMVGSYNNIGLRLQRLGRHDEALKYFQKGLEIILRVHGKTHSYVGIGYNNIGASLMELRKFDKALESFQGALMIDQEVYKKEHPNAATTYNNIGQCLERMEKYKEALKYHQKALRIKLEIHGKEHLDVAICYRNMGMNSERLGKYGKAVDYLQKALQIFEKVYPPSHPELVEAKQELNTVSNKMESQKEVKNQSGLETILNKYGVSNKEQAFRRAAWSGNIGDMKYLIEEEKVDINSQDEKKRMTALHWAVKEKHKDAILWLIKHGAKVDIADIKGKKPKDYDQGGLMN